MINFKPKIPAMLGALAVHAQQARLLGQQTRNDRAISEARNKLSSVTESLNTARNALTRAEQQLTQQKNTPDGKTIVSPEKFPGRSCAAERRKPRS